MEQTTVDHMNATRLPEAEQFDHVSKAGWNGFTRFLLINVVVTIVTLVVIGLLTVWS